jgi:cytochrome P450 family 6
MFLQPTLMVNDPEILKNILIKNFSHFVDRGVYSNPKVDPLTGNIFQISGEKWKTLRTKCSVFFTSSRLKKIFPILTEITDDAIAVTKENLTSSDILELKDFLAR